MTNRAAAARYGRALLDVSRKEGDPQAIERDLAAFVALCDRHEPLARALVNPAIPVQRKVALVTDLANRAALPSILRKLLLLLAERDRLVLLPDLLTEYRNRLMDLMNVVRAEVTTAVPLPPDRVDAIQRALAQMTGRSVTVTMRVDPALLGGVVARIGSTVYDGSVTRQLEKLRETLVGA